MGAVIRLANEEDLEAGLAIEGACTTEHVWQVTRRDAEDQLMVTFNDVRLPRPMSVEYPRSAHDIAEIWKTSDAVLVADLDGAVGGFLTLRAERWRRSAWITDVVVAEPCRRMGIGTALVTAARQWAHSRRLQTIIAEAQSQNGPAIAFFNKQGFTFCGFHERYYANQIALFFARGVR